MSQATGEVLALGVGVALSPVAIVAVVLMLVAPGGRTSALAFVAGWLLSLATVATLVLLLADGADADRNGSAADWVIGVQIVIGILLLIVAVRQWSSRPRGDVDPEPAAWMQKVDGMTPLKAVRMAVLLAAVKPKNPLLTIAAAIAVAETGAGAGAQATAIAIFVALGTLGVGVPLAVSLLMRERGAAVLGSLRDWMVRENAAVIAVLCVIFSAKLLGDAISAI